MTNKIILLNKKPKKRPVIFIGFILIISTIILISNFIKTYDSLTLTGLVKCEESCTITISVPYDKVDHISTDSKIKYLLETYDINEVSYDEPYLNNNIPYEDIILKSDFKTDKKVINFQILYNKQRIIEKIIDIIVERN